MVFPYTIDDPIESSSRAMAEVTIHFPTGKRWLFFITPELLATVGSWVEGTQVRQHLGEKHMIVVSELSPAIIDSVLRQLAAEDDLENRTVPLGDKKGRLEGE